MEDVFPSALNISFYKKGLEGPKSAENGLNYTLPPPPTDQIFGEESLCCVNIKCSIKSPDSHKYHSHHSIIIRLAGFAFSKDLKDSKRKSGKSRKIRGGDPAARVPLIGGLPPVLPSFKIISS